MEAAKTWPWSFELDPLAEHKSNPLTRGAFNQMTADQQVNAVAVAFIGRYERSPYCAFDSMARLLSACQFGNSGTHQTPGTDITWNWKLDVDVNEVPIRIGWHTLRHYIDSVTLTVENAELGQLQATWTQAEQPISTVDTLEKATVDALEKALVALALCPHGEQGAKRARQHVMFNRLYDIRLDGLSQDGQARFRHLAEVIVKLDPDQQHTVAHMLNDLPPPPKAGNSSLSKILIPLAALLVLAGAGYALHRYRQRVALPKA